MPPYTVRVASIVSSLPGASPERVEDLVTDKIEKIAQELPELKQVTSTSRTGLSVVQVELRMEVKPDDLQAVWDRLRRKLNAATDLPEGVIPQLKDDGIGDVYGIAVGITSDGFAYRELKDIAESLRDEFIRLKDAAKVEINGIQEEQVFVEFDNTKLSNYGLTANMLSNQIASTNILNTGGKINVAEERLILEPTGNFNDVEDIRQMLVAVGDGSQVIALGDIATVSRGYIDPPSQLVSINGNPALSLHVSLKDGANILALGQDIDKVINDWQQRLPIGLEVFRIASIDEYIDTKVSDFIENLLQAIAIVMVVMLIFLGLRTGLIIASLIPIVTIGTLMVMGLIDVGINQISLAALIMALGMMVDNGIVVAESIIVKMEEGTPVRTAAISTCSELFVPLLISTLTTSVAFLSFYLAESVMGDIMGPLFVVITIALLTSWIMAFSVISLFCVFFMKVKPADAQKAGLIDRTINALKKQYQKLILLALSWKRTVVVLVVIAFIGSLYGFTKLSVLFFPDSDRNVITVDINLPEGTRIERTKSIVQELESFITTQLLVNESRPDGITSWAAYTGEGPSSYDLGYTADEPNSNYAHILLNTSSFEANSGLIETLDEFCLQNFPSADIKVSLLSGGGGGTPIEIKISGDDPDRLSEIAQEVKAKLFAIDGTKNIKDDWGPKGRKLLISVDRNRARLAGVTNQDIAISLTTALDGFETGEYREGSKNIPIILRGERSIQQGLSTLESLSVFVQQTGRNVPLSQVANIVPLWQYSKIKRANLSRTIIVSSQLSSNGNANTIMNEMKPWLEQEKTQWGTGYDYTLGGDEQESAENMGAVAKYLPLSAFIIVILLIIQFNSMRKMAMVVSVIPLGVIGMVIGLHLFNVPFGFMAFLGVISLAGIVINNAIVLIDRIDVEKEERELIQDAIVMACLQRFRPILLATFTTVLGLIPLYLGGGAIWEPMAVTIMVGLLFGTIVTLIFIPSLYSILYRVSFKDYLSNRRAIT